MSGLALVVALAGVAFASPAQAQSIVTIFPSEDTSPYDFIPALNRGSYQTLYAQTGYDLSGVTHSMTTFLKFDIPSGLLGPGEIVLAADLRIEYTFSFSHEGDPPELVAAMQLHEVLAPWSQLTMVAATKPPVSAPIQTIGGINEFKTIIYDATDLVQGWASGLPNLGVAVTSPDSRPLGMWSIERQLSPTQPPLPETQRNRLIIITGPGELSDSDDDGVANIDDNCPAVPNGDQSDVDGDGVGDLCDNCVEVYNDTQDDVDVTVDENLDDNTNEPGHQSYGDACDGDLDNDGFVGAGDFFGSFRPCMGALVGLEPECAFADFDGDDVVGASDFFGGMRALIGTVPGPGVTE